MWCSWKFLPLECLQMVGGLLLKFSFCHSLKYTSSTWVMFLLLLFFFFYGSFHFLAEKGKETIGESFQFLSNYKNICWKPTRKATQRHKTTVRGNPSESLLVWKFLLTNYPKIWSETAGSFLLSFHMSMFISQDNWITIHHPLALPVPGSIVVILLSVNTFSNNKKKIKNCSCI